MIVKSKMLSPLTDKLKRTNDSEPEQILLRLIIGVFLVIYFCFPWSDGEDLASKITSKGSLITLGYYTGAIVLAIALFYKPIQSPLRRIAGIALDMVSLSIVMFFVGDQSVFLFVLYLWVVLGNGFRYGLNYLYIALIISVIGFSCAITWGDYWQQTHNEAIGLSLLFLLVLIPMYTAFLIKRLHAALALAKQASEAKTRFLANMSHELRTPLNGVIGMGDLLRETKLNDEQKSIVNGMYQSAQTLLGLIENVLDISKIEAGKIVIKREPIDLHALVNSVLAMQSPIAKTKGLSIWCSMDSELPFMVDGDKQHISQVLINLVGNAIKFTDQGSVNLHVYLSEQHSDYVKIRFDVTDTGIGIDQEALQRVFDDFTQVGTSAVRTIGGTGLGTTISKELVELMDGQIGVESELNKGSRFWFELPFKRVADKEIYHTDSHIVILALEQHSTWLKLQLTTWDVSFDSVNSPVHLYALLKQSSTIKQHKKIILVDQQSLGGLSAIGFAQNINKLPFSDSVSLILITDKQHHSFDSDIGQFYISIINTSNDTRALFNAIHAADSIKVKTANVLNIADHVAKLEGSRPLTILVAEDNLVNQQVIEGILKRAGHQIILTADGDNALDILEQRIDDIDLLIVDKNMPHRSGDQVVQALRFMDTKRQLPVIMLTADATPEAKQISMSIGVNEFLTKPIDAYNLLEKIVKLTKDSASEQTLKSALTPLENESNKAETVSQQESTSDLCDTNIITQLMMLDNDPDFMLRLLKGFKQDGDKHIAIIKRSVANDYLEFREALHALKGSASELGATKLANMCIIGEQNKPYHIGTNELYQLARDIEHTYNLTLAALESTIANAANSRY
ncbi:MAG: ATP-binding protein [Gammaproteobacteria bacterium]|nr:ATP-binding protein [Gammaproteobacteria bacterium]